MRLFTQYIMQGKIMRSIESIVQKMYGVTDSSVSISEYYA